jgi:two-component system sensor histidine kinase UhpB
LTELLLRLRDHLPARPGGRWHARSYFAATVLAGLVPALLTGWWIAKPLAASERAQVEQNMVQEASEISTAFDREIVGAQDMLIALASSPFLQERDFEAFHRQASHVAQTLNKQIVLRDFRSEQQLINTAMAWGDDLRRGVVAPRDEAVERLLRMGRPFVSNIFLGPLVGRYVVAVVAPVMVDGAPVYLLAVGIPSERFAEIIGTTLPKAGLLASVFDRKGVIVTRSERNSEFVGKSILPPSTEAWTSRPPRGFVKAPNLQGIAFGWGYVRSELTGWTVDVGLPESILESSSKRILTGFAAGSGALLLIVAGAAYGVGGYLSRSFGALGIDRKPTREEFRVLFESAPNGVVVVDGNGLIVLLNERMEEYFGYSRDELVGKPVEMLVPDRLRTEHASFRRGFARDPETRPMGAGRELFGRRKDGSEFPVEIGLNPIRTGAGNFVMATVVDITARRKAADRLNAALADRDDLRRRLMLAQEGERLRLAHELHDQTGQSLAAVMLELKGIESLVDEDGRVRLRSLRKQLDRMGERLHHVAWELRPASIDELGLASALANYISEWSSQFGIAVDFQCRDTDTDDLPEEIRTTIYRVVQEGLTNIAKHAPDADRVGIVLNRVHASLQMTIEDNGHGFDPNSEPGLAGERSGRGLGLAGMRERLSLIGGTLDIESSIGIGTAIFAHIPLGTERPRA